MISSAVLALYMMIEASKLWGTPKDWASAILCALIAVVSAGVFTLALYWPQIHNRSRS